MPLEPLSLRFPVLFLLLCGCAAPRAAGKGPESPAPAGALTLSLQADLRAPKDLAGRYVSPGAVAHSGDSFAFRLWVDRPAYVYVLRYDPRGWSTLLHPGALAAGDRLAPGTPLTLPGGDERFHLDAEPGEENIYAVATPRPLPEVPGLCAALRLPCGEAGSETLQRGSSPPPPPPPPPEGRLPTERVPVLNRGAERVLTTKASKDGVAQLRFWFDHRP